MEERNQVLEVVQRALWNTTECETMSLDIWYFVSLFSKRSYSLLLITQETQQDHKGRSTIISQIQVLCYFMSWKVHFNIKIKWPVWNDFPTTLGLFSFPSTPFPFWELSFCPALLFLIWGWMISKVISNIKSYGQGSTII